MDRWTTVSYIESCGISLFEQIMFIEKELPVYNDMGYRVIQNDIDTALPLGCVYLSSSSGPYSGMGPTYHRWSDVPEELRRLKYKTTELIDFINKYKSRPKIYDIVKNLPSSLFDNTDQGYKERFLESEAEIQILKDKILDLNNKIQELTSKSTSKTSQAIESRKAKSIQDWELTVEKSVSLAIFCARNGKPKSITQHKDLWRKIWNQSGDSLPRSQGFDAFRRGLPDDLKGS